MERDPDDNLVRELYARFGLAYYLSECLHRTLSIILALSGLPARGHVTTPRVEERLSQAFALTLGDVVGKLQSVLPPELADDAREAVDQRNFLAHSFWFDRAHLMVSTPGVHQLITELSDYSEVFQLLDAQGNEVAGATT